MHGPINAILVDDEKLALQSLKELLQDYCPEITVAGTASSAKEAYDLIVKQRPQLLFLDVAMPNESGFDLLNRLPSLDFEIIFVTGFNEYALDAFKFAAIGYVVKPIESRDIVESVQHAKRRIQLKMENERNQHLLHNVTHPNSPDNRIGIPTMEGLEFVEVGHIIRCEALQRCTKVVIEGRKGMVSSYNLGEFTKLLEPYDFYLTHRSHLINVKHVKRYLREGSVIMSDGSNVLLSRRKKQDFLTLFPHI